MTRPLPTIALIAVHGVGDHKPGASARAVADLLLRLHGDGASRYTAFTERTVRIPTGPARVNPRSAPNVAPDLRRSIFAEQHPFLRTQLQYGGAAARDREEDSPDHQLMRAQLAEYRSTGEPYDTVRLESERASEGADDGTGEPQAIIHVYEMRWADLSRLKSGALRFFAELYQLLFHLAHLGRTAVDHARLEHSTSLLWRAYGAAHTWAVRLLTIFVPAVSLSMLAVVTGAGVVGLSARGAVRDPLIVDRILLGVWLVVAGALVYLVFRVYERLRPGALAVGLAAYIAAATPVAVIVVNAPSARDLLDGTIHVFEAAAVAAAGVWATFYLLGALAGGLALVACARLRDRARSRAWRASRTAISTLAAAASSVLLVTFVLAAAIFHAFRGALPNRAFVATVPAFHRDGQTYAQFFERVFATAAGAGLPLLLLFVTVLAAAVAIALAPALFRELRPPSGSDVFEERAATIEAPRNAPIDTDMLWAAWERFRSDGDRSQRLGDWLTRGLRLLAATAIVLYVAVFLAMPAVSLVYLLTGAASLAPLQASAGTIVLAAGGWLATAAVGLVAFRGRLESLTLGFRPALDIALDVDNYLRTHPRESTPRARIAERYTSLLRYLCKWRDGNGRPYDAIVIVAHSQGTAITADLLSFIQREEDPALEPIRRPLANGVPGTAGRRLFVFTMGSPLRQLYSECFPHLFGWVRGDTDDGVSRPLPAVPREPWMLLPRLEGGHRVYTPAIPDHTAPDPYAMGITRWVNAYRSGDYVGRALWRHALDGCDWIYRYAPSDAATRFAGDAPPITYVSEDAHRSRRELCIGPGAHTHYWDATAKAIAIELDLLVADAAKLAVRVSKDTAPTEEMES